MKIIKTTENFWYKSKYDQPFLKNSVIRTEVQLIYPHPRIITLTIKVINPKKGKLALITPNWIKNSVQNEEDEYRSFKSLWAFLFATPNHVDKWRFVSDNELMAFL